MSAPGGLTADELQALAERVSRDARARKRMAFDVKWGRFWKCPGCGRRYASMLERNYPPGKQDLDACGVPAIQVGYCPPPFRSRPSGVP